MCECIREIWEQGVQAVIVFVFVKLVQESMLKKKYIDWEDFFK